MGGNDVGNPQVELPATQSPLGNYPPWWKTMGQDPWYKTAGKAILGEREFHELGAGNPRTWFDALAPLFFTARGKLSEIAFPYPSAGSRIGGAPISTGGQIRLNAAMRNLERGIEQKAPELGISTDAFKRLLTGEKVENVLQPKSLEQKQRELMNFLKDPNAKPEDIISDYNELP